jgi:hypothetical protein
MSEERNNANQSAPLSRSLATMASCRLTSLPGAWASPTRCILNYSLRSNVDGNIVSRSAYYVESVTRTLLDTRISTTAQPLLGTLGLHGCNAPIRM